MSDPDSPDLEMRKSDLEELRAEAIRRLEKFERKPRQPKQPRQRSWLARKLFGI